jgi:hypothetical protein
MVLSAGQGERLSSGWAAQKSCVCPVTGQVLPLCSCTAGWDSGRAEDDIVGVDVQEGFT